MPFSVAQKYRSILACVVVATAAAAIAAPFVRHGKDVAQQATPGLFSYEAEGFRYEYHAPTGHEGLYDLRNSPDAVVDVLRTHADVGVRCRHALEAKLHVSSLEELRGNYDDTIRRLHALGYL